MTSYPDEHAVCDSPGHAERTRSAECNPDGDW